MHRVHRQKGISLIEVLVVLVILTIGIFSVVKLFPAGFLLNRVSEDRTRATKLASQEISRTQLESIALPDGIVPVVPVLGSGGVQWRLDLSSTPDDLTDVPFDPAATFPWEYYWSNINRARRVIGETVRIPLPAPTVLGRGSVYLLKHGPFMDVNWDGQSSSIFISSSPLTRRTNLDSTIQPSAQLSSTGVYGIDYNAKLIGFFPSGVDRQFLITYQYFDSATGRVETIVDQAIAVPANSDGWLALPVPNGNALMPDSDTVSRRFKQIAVGAPWSTNDPYEFYILSDTVGTIMNMGVVVFNPIGRDYSEQTAGGPQPLTARIDYDVLDWHIIREERTLPVSGPYSIAMNLKNLKRADDIEDDQTTYDGLVYGVSRANNVGDFLIINATTGVQVPRIDIVLGTPNYSINYKEGIVAFADSFGAANQGTSFIFLYRANGDWGLTVQKPFNKYRKNVGPTVSLAEFALGDGAAAGGATRIYFTPSDAGKSVSIRELRYLNGSVSQRAANESYRINADRALFETINGQVVTWIDIREKHPDATGWDYASSGQPLVGVQGISLRARTVWRSGSQVVETSAGNVTKTRWHRQDQDTILTRSSSQ